MRVRTEMGMRLGTAGRSLAEVHLAVLLFGLAGLFGKWLVLSATAIVFGRVVFAGAALAGALALKRRPLFARGMKNLALFVLLGLLLAVHWTSFFRSIQVSSVAVGLLAYSTFPFFTAFLEPLLLKEKLELPPAALSLVCLAGVYRLVAGLDLSGSVLRGVLWGLAAGASFSLLSILNRKMSSTFSSLSIAFQQDFFAALFLLPLLPAGTAGALSFREIGLLALLGIVCTAGAHTLFIRGIRTVGARTASLIGTLEPVYGILLARIFLGERLAPATLQGGGLILAAVVAASLLKRRSF